MKEEPETQRHETNPEPKKKKLNLEEYRKLRKNAKPRSPIKSKQNGWNIPVKQQESESKRLLF